MEIKVKVLAALATGLAISLGANAADDTWSGCYAGAFGSRIETGNQWTTTFINGEAANDNGGSVSGDDTAIGVQFGCDFLESEHGVWGLKVMASDAEVGASRVYLGGTSPSNTLSYLTEDMVAVTGRYGFKVSDNGLLYAQLGYIQTDNRYNDDDPLANPAFHFEQKVDRDGLLWGIGYEHLFSNHVSFFAEYSMADFGKKKIHLDVLGSSNVFDYEAKIDQDISQLSLGVNLRF